MQIDKEEHRALLLEMLDRMQFQGSVRRIVYELGEAIATADVIKAPPPVDGPHAG